MVANLRNIKRNRSDGHTSAYCPQNCWVSVPWAAARCLAFGRRHGIDADRQSPDSSSNASAGRLLMQDRVEEPSIVQCPGCHRPMDAQSAYCNRPSCGYSVRVRHVRHGDEAHCCRRSAEATVTMVGQAALAVEQVARAVQPEPPATQAARRVAQWQQRRQPPARQAKTASIPQARVGLDVPERET